MTCIVAIANGNKVVMGADSAGTDGNLGRSILNNKILKRDDFLYGFSGNPTALQRIRASFVPPEDTTNSPIDYMSSVFIDGIRSLLISHNIAHDSHYEGHMLVGYKGKIFEIWPNYLVTECDRRYAAVGSGGAIALGSLSKSRGTASSRLRKALEAAAEHNAGVAPPFVIESGAYK